MSPTTDDRNFRTLTPAQLLAWAENTAQPMRFRGFRDLSLAKAREAELERSIELTGVEIDRLQRHVERLRSDPVLLERLAREELGMVRPGEVVVIVAPEPQTAAVRPTRPPVPPAPPSSDPRAPESP